MTGLASSSALEQRAGWFGASDACFVALVAGVLLWIAYLGYGNYATLKQTAAARSQAKLVLSWLDAAAQRQVAEPGLRPTPCRSDEAWSVCLLALQAAGQPMAGYQNPLVAGGPVFGGKCDRGQPSTLGTIVVEIGLDTVQGGPPARFVPVPEHERGPGRQLLRLSVCGHGFSVLKVGETWF